jgi:peptidoglycan/xylan/chitin deacetylase (PgdA/CDA1 family)
MSIDTQALRRRLCVLTFHRIVQTKELDHDVEWPTFLSLLEELRAFGPTISTDLAPADSYAGDVILTFDDGTEDHLSVGAELAERGIRGVFFVSAGKIGDAGYLCANDVWRLHSLGHIIGSHGLSHVPLDTVSFREMVHEIQASKHILETILGTPVVYFAPPGGITTPSLPQALARLGYSASRSTQWGIYTSLRQRWAIPHVPVIEMTSRRNWVLSAAQHKRLPTSMLLMKYGRALIPRDLRPKVRSLVDKVLLPANA